MELDNENILNSPALGHRKVCDVGSAILMRSVFFTGRMLQNVTVVDEENPEQRGAPHQRNRAGKSQKSLMDPIEEIQENVPPPPVEQSAGAALSRLFALQAALPHQNLPFPPPPIPLSKPSAQGLTPPFQEEQALLPKENGHPFSPVGKPQNEPLHRAPFLGEKARQETAILNGEPKEAGVLSREAARTMPNPEAPLSKFHDPTVPLIQAPGRIDPASIASAQITPFETAPIPTQPIVSQVGKMASAPAIPAANQIATPLPKSAASVVPSAPPSALVERAKLVEKGTVLEEQAPSAEGEFQVVVHEQPFVIIDNYFGVGRV